MATRGTGKARDNGAATPDASAPNGRANASVYPAVVARSLTVTSRGVRTGEDFADLMSALMGDVIEGTISPNVANAACNAGRQLLRITEMQYRYIKDPSRETLVLAPGETA